MTKYLVSQGDVTFLSERISQDPMRYTLVSKGRNKNPSMQHNAYAMKGLATDPVCGNCGRLYGDQQSEIDKPPAQA